MRQQKEPKKRAKSDHAAAFGEKEKHLSKTWSDRRQLCIISSAIGLRVQRSIRTKRGRHTFSSSTAGVAIRYSWVFASSTLFGESRTNGALTDGVCHWKPDWKVGKVFQGIKSIMGQKKKEKKTVVKWSVQSWNGSLENLRKISNSCRCLLDFQQD